MAKLGSLLGSLSKDVFEGRTSTGSEPFSLFICLDANKFVLLSFFSLIKRIYPRVSNKPLPNDAKGPLPVDVRRSTTLLLKLPIKAITTVTATKTSRAALNFIALTPSCSIRQMLANFLELNSKGLYLS